MPRCHYELLGVTQSATPDELRSAYRKLALQWHPDKNQERVEEATAVFKDIQNAYEVLSDRNERAWYDGHRDAIIRGDDPYAPAAKSQRPADDVNLWSFFSASAFSGFGSSGRGFYAVYGELFQKIHRQEQQAAMLEEQPPALGGPGTPYAQVSAFYAYWAGFTTCRDFAWCDEHNLAIAPNRKVRRLMEEENKKVRKRARREYNEEVRQLAAFVKKRDKRVMEHQVEVARQRKEQEAVAREQREEAERRRARAAQQFVEQEWTKAVEEEEDEGEQEEGGEEVADEQLKGSYFWERNASAQAGGGRSKKTGRERLEEYYCVVCGKSFKSEKQWANHERSRKHLDRAAQLRDVLVHEEAALRAERDDDDDDDDDDDEESTLEGPGTEEQVAPQVRRAGPDHEEVGSRELGQEEQSSNEEEAPLTSASASVTGDEDGDDDEDDGDGDGDGVKLLQRMLRAQRTGRRATAREGTGSAAGGVKSSRLRGRGRQPVASDADVGREPGPVPEAEDSSTLCGGAEDESRNGIHGWQSAAAVGPRHFDTEEEAGSSQNGSGGDLDSGRIGSAVASPDEVALEEREKSLKQKGPVNKSAARRLAKQEKRQAEMRSRHSGVVSDLQAPGNSAASLGHQSADLAGGKADEKHAVTAGKLLGKEQGMETPADSKLCSICNEEFDTRNFLFRHIKATGHAAARK